MNCKLLLSSQLIHSKSQILYNFYKAQKMCCYLFDSVSVSLSQSFISSSTVVFAVFWYWYLIHALIYYIYYYITCNNYISQMYFYSKVFALDANSVWNHSYCISHSFFFYHFIHTSTSSIYKVKKTKFLLGTIDFYYTVPAWESRVVVL